MTTAKGTLSIESWKEKSYHEAKPQKQTKADIKRKLDGDLSGTIEASMLMHYNDAKNAHYAGHLRIKGKLGGKSGSFVVYEHGVFEGGLAKSKWEILQGSGTGGLKTIAGKGGYAADSKSTVRYRLNYTLN